MRNAPYQNPYTARRVDFLFNYEHKAREMESIGLIKNELERRGYSVGLSNTYEEQRVQFTERRNARVVIAPALYNDASLFAFVYRVAGACRKVVNMQWEQALTNQDESDPGFYQNPKGAARDAVHLCWGEEPRQRLLRAGVPADKAKIVGPVQMDVLRPEMRSFHLSRDELGARFDLRSDREWVLFISSFTFVNMSSEEFETEVKSVGSWLKDFVLLSRQSQDAILAWMVEACTAHPERVFIYRPHPSETADPRLEALAREHENFRVIKEHSVRQWIVCCDRIFTWYSTSAAEAFFAGKPCAVLRPVPIPVELDVSIFRGAAMISHREQFFQALAGETPAALDPDLIRRYFAVDPERPTYARICDLLEEIHHSSALDMPPISRARALYYYAQWIRHRAFFIIKDILARTRPGFLLRRLGWLAKKVDNHEALMRRMDADRGKNLASLAELEQLDRLVNVMRRTDGGRATHPESCLSSS
jgi:surface carbohydrate biosynthesis protein